MFDLNDAPSEVCLNGTRDTLYFINEAVWRMDVRADAVPGEPFLKYNNTIYYGLTVDPKTSEVYVADAIDYVQNGVVYRFSPQAVPARHTAGQGHHPRGLLFLPMTGRPFTPLQTVSR